MYALGGLNRSNVSQVLSLLLCHFHTLSIGRFYMKTKKVTGTVITGY